MEIAINNNLLKKLFLEQIGKISDSAVIDLQDNKMFCKVCTSDNSIILGTSISVDGLKGGTVINVGDIKKLVKALDCIDDDDIKLRIESNNLFYEDKKIKFKFHLLENGIINQPKINFEKLSTFNFEGAFTISDKKLNELVKASTFATDSNKVYLSSIGSMLKGDLTDKARYNVDSFEINLAENYTGPQLQNLCLGFEIFRILSTCRYNSLECKVAPKLGVVLFEFSNNIFTSKYIVSALTK
jgi:hypothetical protein